MTIEGFCGNCGRKYKKKEEYLGKDVSCKGCGSKFVLERREDESEEETPPETPERRKLSQAHFVLIGCGGLFAGCMILGLVGMLLEKAGVIESREAKTSREATEKREKEARKVAEMIQEADGHWDAGKMGDAVPIYEEALEKLFIHVESRRLPEIFRRVIKFNAEEGYPDEAKKFLRLALVRNVDVKFELREQKVLLLQDVVKKELRIEKEQRRKRQEEQRRRKIAEEIRGPKPEYSKWDGSYKCIKNFLKNSLNDPYSVKYDAWYEPAPYPGDERFWAVRVRYRAKNAFGAYILKDQIALIQKGKVVKMVDLR